MKNAVIVFLLCFGFTYAGAQEVYTSSGKPGFYKKTKNKKKGYDPSKLILGGGLDAGFSDGTVAVGVSPIVGYHFTERLAAGVGFGFLYYQTPDPYFSPPATTNTTYDKESIFYPNVWARYFIYRGLYATMSVEDDIISKQYPNLDFSTGTQLQVTDHESINSVALLLGLGYRFPLGGRASFFGEITYDCLQDVNSPYYGQPVIRGGIAVGL